VGARERAEVLVLGGGPAGATAAATLARAGVDVRLVEPAGHPRPRVGESLLPGIIPILRDIGALAKIEAAGFARKTGATHWRWGKTPKWDQWFSVADAYDAAWLVERGRFDEILFSHALEQGARLETSPVATLTWDEGRLGGVALRDGREIAARLVIDATGAAALVARARETREEIEGLRHEALWAHWERAGRLPPPRHEQAWFLAAPSHWIWMFPLSDTRTSIGVVRLHRAELDGTTADYEAIVRGDADLMGVLGSEARRVGPVRRERDWSYRVREVGGPGFLLVGDAAGFIDPVLSTGVHLAMHSGWHAAKTAIEVVQGGRVEAEAIAAYARHHRGIFEDLLSLVRYYYDLGRTADDYFWESKRLLERHTRPLGPRKAFIMLTSGLVGNLALDELAAEGDARRRAEIEGHAPGQGDALAFFAIHLRVEIGEPRPADVFIVAEPTDRSEPALFRTRGLDVNAITPRHGSDPISDLRFAPILREIGALFTRLDTLDEATLRERFDAMRPQLAQALPQLDRAAEIVRVFGE
jgi:flavin-dependent dehydrogenase